MSTFLTQGSLFGNSSSQNRPSSKEPPTTTKELESALLYAPFIKPTDKVQVGAKKDVTDLSFSDFQPKRFALNYDPPMIILEYLVPSTGKLYHHKMKLRHLKYDTKTEEVIEYLRKRHPLYFIANKVSVEQITDLINRLKFKIKQLGIVTQQEPENKTGGAAAQSNAVKQQESKKENKEPPAASIASTTAQVRPGSASALGPLPAIGGFKSGSSLPSINDQPKTAGLMNFSEAKKSELYSQVQKDLQRSDEEEEDYEDQYEEEEEDDEDFDANELLNLTDYQNKRKQGSTGFTQQVKQQPLEIENDYDDEEDNEQQEDDVDGWGDDWGAPKKKEDLSKFDYNNTNLNKLSQEQIAMHKKNMDQKFLKNQLKPGDAGFQYDKRIDFTKKAAAVEKDASWDEEEDNVDNYFDDDFM